MDWRHILTLLIAVYAGYWLGKKFPGTVPTPGA